FLHVVYDGIGELFYLAREVYRPYLARPIVPLFMDERIFDIADELVAHTLRVARVGHVVVILRRFHTAFAVAEKTYLKACVVLYRFRLVNVRTSRDSLFYGHFPIGIRSALCVPFWTH